MFYLYKKYLFKYLFSTPPGDALRMGVMVARNGAQRFDHLEVFRHSIKKTI